MAATYKLNMAVITRTLDNAVRQKDIPSIRAKLVSEAKSAEPIIGDTLAGELEGHWVTKELMSGEVGRAESGFPAGNIATFFGLPDSLIRSSLGKFHSLISKPISTVIRKIPGTKQYRISMNFPPVSAFYGESPSPEGYSGSWLEKLEKAGLQNFEKFLSGLGFSGSRSGGGIQSKYSIKKRESYTVPAIPYISDIYKSAFSGSRGWANRLLSSIVGKAQK